jgi:hypothetical protein
MCSVPSTCVVFARVMKALLPCASTYMTRDCRIAEKREINRHMPAEQRRSEENIPAVPDTVDQQQQSNTTQQWTVTGRQRMQ